MREISNAIGNALPFWLSLLFLPLLAPGVIWGGWWLVLAPIFGIFGYTLLDAAFGRDTSNPDPDTPDGALFWHRLITYIWCPIQIAAIFGTLFYVTHTDHLSAFEEIAAFIGVGILTGAVGIVYAHELVHQSARWERALGEVLMITVLYGHFVTEHLSVHHRYVGTPKDPATARFGEGFYRYFLRVIPQSFTSAWAVEAARARHKHGRVLHLSNPFWRYICGGALCLLLGYVIGGGWGVLLFLVQAGFAIWQLEQINYIEHYGLERQALGGGKYEPIRPHHSWNSDHAVTNYLLINLQRHADHHAKPSRRFPVLQTYGDDDVPQLPYGYPLLTWIVYVPPLWHRIMDPRVRAWRRRFYPDVDTWDVT